MAKTLEDKKRIKDTFFAAKAPKAKGVVIPPLRVEAIRFNLVGLTPLVQRPRVARRKRACEFYLSKEGWRGIPTYGIKQSLMGAGRLEGLVASSVRTGNLLARPDGFDVVEGTPLVRITKGEPRDAVEVGEKLAGGIVYDAGWEASVVIEFDADVFKATGIVQLLLVAGAQVGLGALRPDAHRFLTRKSDPSFEYGTYAVTT